MQSTPKPPLPQRKRPAHMAPVERHNEPILLFVTIGLQPRVPALANAAFRDAFVRACADADVWSVGRYVRLNPVRKGLVARADEWPWQGELNVLRW